MGSEIHEQYRDQFPVTESLIYLNHAGVAPLCKPAADAMEQLAEEALGSAACIMTNGWQPTKGSGRRRRG